MKTIIVPLDFSNESLNGLNYSLMLANKTSANIQMIHVVGKNDSIDSQLQKTETQLAIIKFEDVLLKYKEKCSSKVTLNYNIKEGKIFEEVTNLAQLFDEALIVLSTHGASGFEELFIGGNAYKIASHSKIPVITVRKKCLLANINKIVLPLDSTIETCEKVPYTVKIAQQFNSKIHLLSVQHSDSQQLNKKTHQYVEQVSSYIDSHKVSYIVEHLQGENVTDTVLDYANSVKADLISIMTEQETNISKFFLGSYAHQMINKAFIPVFLFPNYQLRTITNDIWDLGAFNA
jgi:nucleotide-binding universal stress UspA family protein